SRVGAGVITAILVQDDVARDPWLFQALRVGGAVGAELVQPIHDRLAMVRITDHVEVRHQDGEGVLVPGAKQDDGLFVGDRLARHPIDETAALEFKLAVFGHVLSLPTVAALAAALRGDVALFDVPGRGDVIAAVQAPQAVLVGLPWRSFGSIEDAVELIVAIHWLALLQSLEQWRRPCPCASSPWWSRIEAAGQDR